MSDPVSMARSARERLAQALGALQSPGVPAALLGAAEPIAMAMGALHQIEASHGAATAQAAPGALDAVRRALGALQGDASGHPAVAHAIEGVAGSLGMVHGLTRLLAAPAAAPPTQPAAIPQQARRADPALAGTLVADTGAQPVAAAAPAVQWAAPRAAAPAQAAPVQPAQAVAQAAPKAAPAGIPRVEAELGVHSSTNFYKGLSGNDIIEAGGIFIATYQIPPIGRELLVHVTMPGGYEFEARGVVRWAREAPASSSGGSADAPPGYGAQFTHITPEAKQLVYRYVRNREPLFHDDL